MKRKILTKSFSPALALVCLLAGCGTMLLKQEAPEMEQRLLAAGFIQVPADTVEKAANLQRLPPYKLVKRKTKGQDIYA